MQEQDPWVGQPLVPPGDYRTLANMRLNKLTGRPTYQHVPTGFSELDAWLGGGLCRGVILFYGDAGCGKSLLARALASRFRAPNAYTCSCCNGVIGGSLYVFAESEIDPPNRAKYPHVNSWSYSETLPMWDAVVHQLRTAIWHLKPRLVVIDSITDCFSGTRKAVEEADLREAIKLVNHEYQGRVPIVCISEVRGGGQYQSTAGGEKVRHQNLMLVQLQHVYIDYPSQATAFGLEMGDQAYVLRVHKDRHNLANTKSRAFVTYDFNADKTVRDVHLAEIKPRRATGLLPPSMQKQAALPIQQPDENEGW